MKVEIVAQVVTKSDKKGERQNAQTSRKRWRPKQTSVKRLALDIADSIEAHPGRTPAQYTDDPELIALIVAALAKKEHV